MFVISWVWVLAACGQENGVYADFTTSMGNFTCRLHYAASPKAVANFIGLATGQRAWLDERGGWVKTNLFHNGLTFHRVIPGFMIQGGSPNGQGTDGPGYAFVDEFQSTNRFNSEGVLASANSGPDSNGAQYFVTVTNTPWLNDVHTIFGRVIGGMSVVHAISQVPRDANDRPLTDVVVQNVRIRRIGTAAQAFDINAQGLPVVTNAPLKIAPAGANVTLTFTNRLYADNRLYASTNLATWTAEPLGIEVSGTPANSFQIPVSGQRRYYRLPQVLYGGSTLAPKTVTNRTLVLRFNGYGTNTTVFNGSGGGTYSWPYLGYGGAVESYNWVQEAYRARLWPITWQGLVRFFLRLDFTNATGGTFSGNADNLTQDPVSGWYTLNP